MPLGLELIPINLDHAGAPVPRFFFDTYDGNHFVPDSEGQDLEGIEAARRVAQEELPQMVWDELPDGDQRTFMVSVRNEAGQVVLRAALSLIVEYPLQALLGEGEAET